MDLIFMSNEQTIIDVIIPVYGGYDETVACIESVLKHPQKKVTCNLIIINDCSPEPSIHEYLDGLKEHQYLTVLSNSINLGFVATVNKGMSRNPDHDVLLLNSDAEVHGDWLDRIYEHYSNDASIATITPFSNNATICSFPNTCKDNDLILNKSIADIDDAFAMCGEKQNFDVPTGVGFCMFISRVSLNSVGFFDVEAFGKGYGEENDFCRKVAAKNFRNILCGNVFVYHAGSVSFAGTQNEKIKNALLVLEERYPEYPALVQQHILANPAKQLRINVLLHLLSQETTRAKVLHIGHGIGGGVQFHINSLRDFLDNTLINLELAPLNEGKTVRLDLSSRYYSDTLNFHMPEQYPELLQTLRYIGISRLHFHHYMFVPEKLQQLSVDIGAEFYFSIHDYYCINGNPTLTDKDGVFCGDLDTNKRDELCLKSRPLTHGKSILQWRQHFTDLLEKADCIISPSVDCKTRFNKDFPSLNIVATPHEDVHNTVQAPTSKNEFGSTLKILTLGALSPEKGADVIEGCAQRLSNNKNINIELLGYAYRPLDTSVRTHGHYDNDTLQETIAEIHPDIIWLPAQWPETYSYTLSAAIKYGCPVVISNLGAPVERVAKKDNCYALPWDSTVQEWAEFFIHFLNKDLEKYTHYKTINSNLGLYVDDFYKVNYPIFDKIILSNHIPPDLLSITSVTAIAGQLSQKEKLLTYLYKIYSHRFLRKIVKIIPVHILRYIKRSLSSQPIDKLIK
jgi:GT2 family glycosyltransferase/glycosyltransferase involved in cell wall biosynthesis